MAGSGVILLFCLCALGAASASGNIGAPWKPRVEYEYELNARSLAGLPTLQGQYSGVQYSGRVRVQGLTPDTAIIKLEKMWWSSIHARMQSGWWNVQPQANLTLPGHGHHDSQQPQGGNGQSLPLSGATAVLRFDNGQVSNVIISKAAEDWEANLIQGIAGQMQMQLSPKSANSIHGMNPSQKQIDNGVFRVMESAVTGRCEVLYEVAPTNPPAQKSAAEAKMCAGKQYVQITKSKNYTNCEQYAEQTRGLPKCHPAGNSCGSLWTRNSLSQLIGCGSGSDIQLVQSISSGSMLAELQLREDSKATIVNAVNLTLTRMDSVKERLPTPKDGQVLKHLGLRVAGKQIPNDQENSSEEADSNESDDSVEVIRHNNNHMNANNDDSANGIYSADDSDSAKKQQKKYKNQKKSQMSHSGESDDSDSSDESGDSRKQKHHGKKNQMDSSDGSSDSRKSQQKNHGKKNQMDSSDDSNSSDDSSDSRKQKHHGKKNQMESSDDSSDSRKSQQKNHGKKNGDNQWNAYQEDSASADSSEDSNESRKHHHKQQAKKLSRKNRSAHGRSDDDDNMAANSDMFDGVLSPANVQKNSTLRDTLQARLVQEVQKAAMELAQTQGPNTRTLERVATAIRIARAMSTQQLRKIQEQVSGNADQWYLYRDIVAMCASEACVQTSLSWIKERKMSAMSAQQMVSRLPDRVAKPNAGILKQLQEAFQSNDDEQVKIAAALAMGKLAAGAPKSAASKAAAFLSESMSKESAKSSLRAALTSALGMTASPSSIQPLLVVAKNTKMTPYQRAQATLALSGCALRNPALVRDALLSLYSAPLNPAPVRMAAASVLVYARPSLTVWQRLAVSTFYEKDPVVSSFIWSTIHSFAALEDPIYAEQAKHARLVKPLARPMPQGMHLAFNMVKTSIESSLNQLQMNQHDQFLLTTPIDASNMYYRSNLRQSGVSRINNQIQGWAANPDDLVQAAMEAVFGREDKTAARPPQKDVPHSTRSIHEKLSIVRRRLEDPQGHLQVTLEPFVKNLFMPFDKETPNRVVKAMTKYMDEARSGNGKTFHAQQMAGEEMSVSTVNEMGFPVNLRLQAPWVARAAGNVQLLQNNSVHFNVTMMYASALSAHLTLQPSWASREYLAAVNGHAMLQLPATSVKVNVDLKDGRVSVRAEPQAEHWSQGPQHSNAALVARLALQPFTASVDLSRAEIASESAVAHNATNARMEQEQQQQELSAWENVSILMRSPAKPNALIAWLRESRSVLGYPALGKPLSPSRLEVLVARPQPVNISFSLVKAMKQNDGKLKIVYPQNLRWEENQPQPQPEAPTTTAAPETTTAASESTTTVAPERAAHSSTKDYGMQGNGSIYGDNGVINYDSAEFNATTLDPYNNRVNGSNELYVLSQVLSGLQGGRAYVVGCNVTAEGPQTSRFTAFWTHASSLASRLQRYGAFARSDDDKSQVAATATLQRSPRAAMDIAQALNQAPEMIVKAEYAQTDSKAFKSVITAVMETSRSADKNRRLWNLAREQNCMQPKNASIDRECRSVLSSANTPDQYNMTVNYNDQVAAKMGGSVRVALLALRSYFWNKGQVAVDNLTDGHINELSTGITVLPDGSIDGWMKTPRTLTEVVGGTVPGPLQVTMAPISKPNREVFCGVNSNTLFTLDGIKANYQMDDCWHLLAKDCSGKSRIAVLARAHSGNSSALDVEINIDNYQIAEMNPNGAWLNGVSVNEIASPLNGATAEVRDAKDVRVMQVQRASDGAILVNMPDHGMNVIYGNSSVLIQAGASLRGRLCGMCGDYDGHSFGEFSNPKDKIEKTAQAFADSYKLDCANNGKGRN